MNETELRDAFEKWFQTTPYSMPVVWPRESVKGYLLEGWQACAQHLAFMQVPQIEQQATPVMGKFYIAEPRYSTNGEYEVYVVCPDYRRFIKSFDTQAEALAYIKQCQQAPVKDAPVPAPWTYRWYGSGEDRGYSIFEIRGECVAYLGDQVSGDAVAALVMNHNATAPDARKLGALVAPVKDAPQDDLSLCPQCGGPADNGHDRCIPPSAYMCSKCCAQEDAEKESPQVAPDREAVANMNAARQAIKQLLHAACDREMGSRQFNSYIDYAKDVLAQIDASDSHKATAPQHRPTVTQEPVAKTPRATNVEVTRPAEGGSGVAKCSESSPEG